ncbi:hypothetical protein PISMIDRAFT_678477 [Pisolithus microcarpus 441]|uniref:Unplaced genomic scaffold scaffold_35, whole genome shotgun sequence n=1 Tax=Pisolithus microcarpus 441 TaxID=765257 RepID=A0A0C9Z4W0_9AGAM|nr:hypothetical protein PISMIDRAFT_678477 [Pisolithus microcarpus 441]
MQVRSTAIWVNVIGRITPTNYIFGLGKIFTDHLNHDHSSLHEVAYSAHYYV